MKCRGSPVPTKNITASSIPTCRATKDMTSAFVECDETCVFSWKVSGDCEQNVPDKFYWYVYLGILQRGSPGKFFIKPMPLRQSVGEARIPQLTKEEYIRALNDAGFSSDTRAVMFTDSAPTFVSTGHPGIVDAKHVNHSEQEWSRSVEVLHKPDQLRPALAHTQTIDRAWRSLKEDVPKNQSGKTQEQRDILDIHLRQRQWYMMLAGQDRWKAFCECLPHFREYLARWNEDDAEMPAEVLADARNSLNKRDSQTEKSVEPACLQLVDDMVVLPQAPDQCLLGETHDGVPSDVHARMLDLAAQGIIPVTTMAQRQRARGTSGSTYGVPKFLSEAFTYGYISPNLPAPKNFVWRCENKSWFLATKGG